MQVIICFLLHLIFARFGKPQCFGEEGQVCCNGFIWDATEKRCKQCGIGLYGSKCTLRCRYPSYGEKCLSMCTCVKSVCDPAYGCENRNNSTINKTSTEVYQTLTKATSTTESISKTTDLFHVPNIYVFSLIIILGSAILIFPVVFLIYRMVTLRMRLRMLHFERRDENDRNIAIYKTAESRISPNSIIDRAERTGMQDIHENNHEYEDISSEQSQEYRSHSEKSTPSNDSSKLDMDYLSPVSHLVP